MSDCRLKFKECVDCKEWNGNRTHCANICSKPYAAWDGFNRYMELEEQGLLIKLHFGIGDLVYELVKGEDGECFIVTMKCRTKYLLYLLNEKVGGTVFLTKEEAEAALAEMEDRDE